IDQVDWVVNYVSVKIGPPIESDRILRCPPPDSWIVISRPEPHEPCVLVVEPPREPKRRQARARVLGDVAELVVVDAFNSSACRGVHNEARTAEVIAEDSERPRG